MSHIESIYIFPVTIIETVWVSLSYELTLCTTPCSLTTSFSWHGFSEHQLANLFLSLLKQIQYKFDISDQVCWTKYSYTHQRDDTTQHTWMSGTGQMQGWECTVTWNSAMRMAASCVWREPCVQRQLTVGNIRISLSILAPTFLKCVLKSLTSLFVYQ